MNSARPFILCLTGSLGMGKSRTAQFFAELGVPVHDSDAVVHALYEGEAVPAIESAFPGAAADGKIDRAKLAKMVLGNDVALARLEAIVHPLVAPRATSSWPTRRPAVRSWWCSIFRSCSKPGASATAMRSSW